MAILQKKAPKVSVIIVNYQTDALVVNLVHTIGNDQTIEIIIIDNSVTESLQKKLPRYANVRYYFQNNNVGFAKANNIGIKKAKGEWLFLLNSDTTATGAQIHQLVETCRAQKFTVAAPMLLNKDKTMQESVGYFDTAMKHMINYIFARPRFVKTNTINQNTAVDFAIGAAMLIHKSVFEKIGFLDNKHFFMYFEDIDFCYRLYKNHIPIVYVPAIKVMHFGGQSANQDIARKNFNYMQARDAYIRKHRGKFILYLNTLFKLFT